MKMGVFNNPSEETVISIPTNTRAYHALSLDEVRSDLKPALIDQDASKQEVWFDSDHAGVGGGQEPPMDGVSLAEDNPLRWMVLHAIQNGLRFDKDFLEKYRIYPDRVETELGLVHTSTRSELDPKDKGVRKVFAQNKGQTSFDDTVCVFETVLRRMKHDDTYRPLALDQLSKFEIVTYAGITHLYDQSKLRTKLSDSTLFDDVLEQEAKTKPASMRVIRRNQVVK
jgi:hypothetical protein